MATILAHIKVRPGTEGAFEAVSRRLYARSHGGEPDLVRYEYWRGAEAGRYYCLLSFPDYRTFMVHQTSDHHEAEVAELGRVMAEFSLEWLDPVPDAAPLPPTRAQALADDASPLARRYAESIPVRVQAWWSEVPPA